MGIVAPRSPDVDAFARNLESAETWLEPFNGFGSDTFLVGTPAFDFTRYRSWVAARFPPARFRQLARMPPSPLAVGMASDAHPIITPNKEGPLAAIRAALREAGARPADIATWDLHATATPERLHRGRELARRAAGNGAGHRAVSRPWRRTG